LFIFFFQAEDGIRDKLVTGVQTCALPIYQFAPAQVTSFTGPIAAVDGGGEITLILKTDGTVWACGWNGYGQMGQGYTSTKIDTRSEERRVGKECRYWRWRER